MRTAGKFKIVSWPPSSLPALVLACLIAGLARGEESVARSIRRLTGARTKIVWARGSNGIGSPFGPAAGEQWNIMALDTDAAGGQERRLTAEPGPWGVPLITPSGTRVIWSGNHQIWISDWDGKNSKKLLDGPAAVGVAEDPPGTEWVYVPGKKGSDGQQQDILNRVQIDNPAKQELVWDKTGFDRKWDFTRDGKFGASSLPFPNAGAVSLPNGGLKVVGAGCTPSLSADASLVMHMYAVGHRGIYLYNRDGSNRRYIDLRNGAPSIESVPDPNFWFTSFAHYDKRFCSFSGPHPGMGTRGQSQGNIHFCQFNEQFDGIAQWVQVTDFPEVETQPYVWIDSRPSPAPLEKIEIAASTANPMSADGRGQVAVSLKNNSEQALRGTLQLLLPEGWSSQPTEAPFEAAAGAEQRGTLTMVAPARVSSGKVAFHVAIRDAEGKMLDCIRLSLKTVTPMEVSAETPRTVRPGK